MGSAGVTWIRDDETKIFEYETGGTVYSVGAVDGEPTQFDEYPGSALNRDRSACVAAGRLFGSLRPCGDGTAGLCVLPQRW